MKEEFIEQQNNDYSTFVINEPIIEQYPKIYEQTIKNFSENDSNIFKSNLNFHIKSFLDDLKRENQMLSLNIQLADAAPYEDIYFISNSVPISETNISYNNNSANNTLIAKKRGRVRKEINKGRKAHSKFEKDNIKRKIQSNYMNFLVKYVNYQIKKKIDRDFPLFKNIKYSFKKNVNRKFFEELKQKTIGEILQEKGTNKTKEKNSSLSNKEVFQLVTEKNEEIKKLLNKNYLDMFVNIFASKEVYSNCKKRKQLGIPNSIDLFDDLLLREKENNKGFNEGSPENYIEKVIDICKSEFTLKNKETKSNTLFRTEVSE